MKQQKAASGGKAVVNWRIPKMILKGIREHAESETRSINGQVEVMLKQWLEWHRAGVRIVLHNDEANETQDVTKEQRPGNIAPTPPGIGTRPIGGTSEPPRRIQDMAKAHSKSSIPPEVAKQIVESDGDWEGSDPQKQFVGTKVKI